MQFGAFSIGSIPITPAYFVVYLKQITGLNISLRRETIKPLTVGGSPADLLNGTEAQMVEQPVVSRKGAGSTPVCTAVIEAKRCGVSL